MMPLRASGALVILGMMVIHLQDYFHDRTTCFTITFALLAAGALVLVGLAGRVRIPGAPARCGVEWTARIAGCLACLGLLVVHLFPHWHTTDRLLYIGSAATVLSCCLLLAGGRAARVAAPVAGAAFLLMLTTPQRYQGSTFFASRDAFFQVTSVATYVFLAASCMLRLRSTVVLAGAIVAGTLLRVHAIDHHECHAAHRDMLPLVQYACEAFLDGRNPYTVLFWANHDLPLTYLPVMWLTYLPALVLGADIRWTSIVATVVIAVLVWRWGRARLPGRGSGSLHGPGDLGLAPVAVAFLFQPEVFWNSVHGEPIVYWLWLVLFLHCVWSRRPWAAAIVLGLLLGTRHFAVLVIPFAVLWFVLHTGGWKAGVLRILVAGSLACLVILPFFHGHPDSFLYGVYDWLVGYGASRKHWWDVQIGFQQYFYHGERQSLLPWIQAAGTAASLAAACVLSAWAAVRRWGGRARDLVTWLPLVAGYAVFIMFNSMIWKSFLFPLLLLLLFAGAVAARSETPRRRPPTWERTLLEPRLLIPSAIVLLAVLSWSAYTLARGFQRHRDQRDIQQAAHYVAGRILWSGDLLVDWSRVMAGHVRVESNFKDVTLPQGVRVVRRLRTRDLTSVERIVLFDGFSRFDPGRDFPDLVRVTSRRLGRSHVHVFRPPHHFVKAGWRLSADPSAIRSAFHMGDKPPSFRSRRKGQRWIFDHLPHYNYVGPKVLRVMRTPFRCIWAHPAEDLTLRISVNVPRAAPAVLVSGIDDKAVRPFLSSITVSFLPGDDRARALTFSHPNSPGRFFWGLGEIEAGNHVIEVRTDQAGMHHFGIDLLLGPPPAEGS